MSIIYPFFLGGGSGGGTGETEFKNLTDTPNSYAGQAGKITIVNQAEDALEFTDNKFKNLTDTPDNYVGQDGKILTVKSGSCSNPAFTTEATCLLPNIWTDGSINFIGHGISVLFANFDVRFFGELGLPSTQGWTTSDATVYKGSCSDPAFTTEATCLLPNTWTPETILGKVKDSIKLDDGRAEIAVNAINWQNALTYGLSYSSVMRFESRTISNSLFSGIGFSAANDPRTGTGKIGRIDLQINMDVNDEFITVLLHGETVVILDGNNNRPLVKINDYFKFECKLNPTPDAGVNFGAIDLIVNGVYIYSGVMFNATNNVANDKVLIVPWSTLGSSVYYISDFGATVYEESATKLLTEVEMDNSDIDIVTPGGKRDYEVIIPDSFQRQLGDTIRLIAKNAESTVIFRTENLTTPKTLFNGENKLEIPIETEKEVAFTNIVMDGNIYQGVVDDEHEHIPVDASINVTIYKDGDLEALATAEVITVDSDMTFTFKSAITTSVRFEVLEGGTLTIRGYGMYSLIWEGTGTFITSVLAPMHIQDITMISENSGTLLDLSGNIDTHVVFNFCVLIGWNMGNVYNISTSPIAPQFYIEYSVFFGWKSGLVCTNTTDVGITDCTLLQLKGVSANEPFITMQGNVPVGLYASGTTGAMEVGESFLSIDPQISNSSRIQIASQSLKGEYFKTDGTQGTFTAVADASIASTPILNVLNIGGLARFNFLTETTFDNQEVVISGFVANPEYNGTHTIISGTTGFFIIAVAFGTTENVGSFSSNSVTLTDTSTSLADGDTLTIESQSELDYDGGAIVYNKLVNSFQISKPYSATDSGIWNTSGLNQTDKRVIASNNPSQASSKYIGAGFMNGNTVANSTITNTVYTDIVLGGAGLNKASNIERWKIIDPVLGILEYTGNEPFSGFIDYTLSSSGGGGTNEFRYKWVVDNGAGYVNLPDNKYSKNNMGATPVSTSDKIPLAVVRGDRVKPQITRMDGGSTHITQDFSVSITSS